jgi:hypothetical protein
MDAHRLFLLVTGAILYIQKSEVPETDATNDDTHI